MTSSVSAAGSSGAPDYFSSDNNTQAGDSSYDKTSAKPSTQPSADDTSTSSRQDTQTSDSETKEDVTDAKQSTQPSTNTTDTGGNTSAASSNASLSDNTRNNPPPEQTKRNPDTTDETEENVPGSAKRFGQLPQDGDEGEHRQTQTGSAGWLAASDGITHAGTASSHEPGEPDARAVPHSLPAVAPQQKGEPVREFMADSSNSSPRVRRQTPQPQSDWQTNLNIYKSTAFQFRELDGGHMADAAGLPENTFDNSCVGMTTTVMQNIANSAGRPSLVESADDMLQHLSDPNTRQQTVEQINGNQETNAHSFNVHLNNFQQSPGTNNLSGDELVSDLRTHFSGPHPTDDASGSQEQTMAEIGLWLGDGRAHSILVNRPFPASRSDPGNSEVRLNQIYELYDPSYGVFRYENFQQMATGLNNLYENGYSNSGGVINARTTYFSDSRTNRPYDESNPRPPAFPTGMALGNLPGRDDLDELMASDQLLDLPDFDFPGSSGWGGPRDDLKRTDASGNHPFALFRPSTLSPDEIMKAGGFQARNTPLADVNLNLHDFNVSGSSAANDSAGWLATFRQRNTAVDRLTGSAGKTNYVYYIAPTQNMVDVNETLGQGRARQPGNQEVAALGNIAAAQIRGWQPVGADGGLGSYVKNPGYRYDIYDQTRMAGAQPQLAHFSPEDTAWADAAHSPFVTAEQHGGKTMYRPNENPQLVTARFYQNAQADVADRAAEQAQHRDYRGPLTIHPLWNNDEGKGNATLKFDSGHPVIDRSDPQDGNDQFRFGDDGRIHLVNDNNKVLRVDGQGNTYIGDLPTDKNNVNGVFGFDSATGGLNHQEDQKWLSEGIVAQTPFVAAPMSGGGGLIERQKWRFEDPQGNTVRPPVPETAFRGFTAGTPEQLYQFYNQPNDALPSGTTHFVTHVPTVKHDLGNSFLDYPDHIAQGDAGAARTWLAGRNAAWLFKDGFYAVAAGPHALEVRTIGGTPVWRAEIDPATGHETYKMFQNGVSSNYSIPKRTWNQIYEHEQRDIALYKLMQQNYM